MKDDVDPSVWDRAQKRPYTFSWYQRETVPAPRTWWDRLRFRHPTIYIWTRRCVVFHVAEVDVDAFGGWPAIFDAFLLPMIPGGAGNVGPWGTQLERDPDPGEYIRTRTNLLPKSEPSAEQPRNPPRCYTHQHADRGDSAGPA
ncbi:hypothetical protein LCGC14_1083440 [marine sediment metagenome]|uniref:Uncharacterized protein n=1 Tax=marine sediment metagenome TaxID=412755 RepID=A0A0F9PXU2_9ZZZZ